MPYCVKDDYEEVFAKCGITDLLDSKASTLSNGQAMRVSLARTILKGSSLFLIDEPTGALDTENAKAVYSLLREIAKTALVIVASHDVALISPYCDGFITLQKGKLVGFQAPGGKGNGFAAQSPSKPRYQDPKEIQGPVFSEAHPRRCRP